jgi:hypothetical protein
MIVADRQWDDCMSSFRSLPWTELRELAYVLLNGTPETRRAAALRLLEKDDQRWLPLLVGTVRSTEAWQTRARCLEALGTVAGASEQQQAEAILAALFSRSGN